MKYSLIVVVRHILCHTGACTSLFVFSWAGGTWPLTIEKRGREKRQATENVSHLDKEAATLMQQCPSFIFYSV